MCQRMRRMHATPLALYSMLDSSALIRFQLAQMRRYIVNIARQRHRAPASRAWDEPCMSSWAVGLRVHR